MTSTENNRQSASKILALAFSFPPDAGSGSLRNLKILKYMPQLGWRMQVLTRRAKDAEIEQAQGLVDEIPENCTVIRTRYIDTPVFFGQLKRLFWPFGRKKKKASGQQTAPSANDSSGASAGAPSRRGLFSRIKDFVTHCFSIPDRVAGWLPFGIWAGCRAMRREKADVIYAVGKPWTAFFVGYFLKLWYRKPLVLDFMDPWAATTWSWSKPRLFWWIDRKLEKFIVKRADFIVANTETLRQDFIDRLGVAPERVEVLTCGYDANDFEPARQDSPASPDSPFTVTHTGTFYKRRSPLSFLKAVKRLVDQGEIPIDRLRINFVGRNSVRDPELFELMKDPVIQEVMHHEPWVPHDHVLEYLYASHLLLLVQPDTKLQIPAKLYEYAATRRPVLALCDREGAVDQIMNAEGWGDVVPSDDVEEIAHSLLKSYQHYADGIVTLLDSEGVDRYSTHALAVKLSGYLSSVMPESASAHEREAVAV